MLTLTTRLNSPFHLGKKTSSSVLIPLLAWYATFNVLLVCIQSYAVTPVVDVAASRMKVNIGASTTLFCNVTRTNPDITDYTWRNEDANTEFNVSNTDTLMLVLLTAQDFGTISCTATNAAGISGKANVTIERECKLSLIYCSESIGNMHGDLVNF